MEMEIKSKKIMIIERDYCLCSFGIPIEENGYGEKGMEKRGNIDKKGEIEISSQTYKKRKTRF
jgi:hypothetical protein